jgi:hypothetical protein
MNKNTTNLHTANWRRQSLIVSMSAMLCGLLFSRALLSSSLIIFILLALVHRQIGAQIRYFLLSPFLYATTILFFIPLLSGLWSEDVAKWLEIIRIKLPLLFLPLCFAKPQMLRKRDWQKVGWIFLFLVLLGASWSMWQYVRDVEGVQHGYLSAGVIRTPLGNDHVRFSLLVNIAIIVAVMQFFIYKKTFSRAAHISLWLIISAFILFLHVLAARTGLFCFYSCLLLFIIWLFAGQGKRRGAIAMLAILLALPVLSYLILPTFRNRISYLKYDLSFASKDIYLKGSNDGSRLRSIKAGLYILQQHPVTGAGFGDIQHDTYNWYAMHYPGMIASDRIIPCSEFIVYGAGAGIAGMISFAVILVLPFFLKSLGRNIFWWMVNVSFLLSYLFDMGLEVQYGVFVHAFVLLFLYRWIRIESHCDH